MILFQNGFIICYSFHLNLLKMSRQKVLHVYYSNDIKEIFFDWLYWYAFLLVRKTLLNPINNQQNIYNFWAQKSRKTSFMERFSMPSVTVFFFLIFNNFLMFPIIWCDCLHGDILSQFGSTLCVPKRKLYIFSSLLG